MATESDAPSSVAGSVGERLRVAREARQASLRDIAATTKISVSALEAVEQSDLSSLPGGIFTRAFVRAYATEVGLDPEETVRDFVAEFKVRVAESTTSGSEARAHDPFQSQQRIAGAGLTLVLIGLPVALLLAFLGMRDTSVADDTVDSTPAAVVEAPPSSARVEPSPRPIPTPPAETLAVAADAPLTLVLRPSDECWVSLTIDGNLVFSRVMRPGESASYDADTEIILNIGDAGAFGFALNNRDGRSLGDSGEVVTATITPENYRSFFAP
ncbi:MAG: helix-turn-helix domain-containing protein [Vicinamibacterales bacterium]|nr:helix-turn-helix domain-containing protein [Vicinamibacterales bacterium]